MNSTNNVPNPYSAQSYSQTLLINVTRILLGFLAIVGNGLILLTIAKNPIVRNNLCNLLIGVLAFADFWTGLGYFLNSTVVLSFQLVPWYNYTTGECLIMEYMMLSGIQMSQIATIFIALDRLKAVQNPMLYSAQDPMQRSLLALATTTIYSLISTAFIFVGIDFNSYPSPLFCSAGSVLNHFYVIYWDIFALIVAITVIVCYFRTSRTMTKKLSTAGTDPMNHELARQKAVFKTITIVLVVYGLCWCLPMSGLFIASLLKADPVLLGKVTSVVGTTSIINASANVMVYAWKHKELGAAMRRVFSTQIDPITNSIQPSATQQWKIGYLM